MNAVGVDVNTARAPLLARVSGVGRHGGEEHRALARAERRLSQRASDLLRCRGLGAKTFEQAAGFLRIRGGDNPLDMTAVHPETYAVVEQMARRPRQAGAELMGRDAGC